MDKEEKKCKNQSMVIVNNNTRTIRPITLEVLVQHQKLKLKIGRKNSDINSRDL